MADFGEYTHPTGRKDHRCVWCNGPIPKGEQHTQFKGMFEGEWQNWRMHEECREDCDLNCEGGFLQGDGEMPERVKALVAAVSL